MFGLFKKKPELEFDPEDYNWMKQDHEFEPHTYRNPITGSYFSWSNTGKWVAHTLPKPGPGCERFENPMTEEDMLLLIHLDLQNQRKNKTP